MVHLLLDLYCLLSPAVVQWKRETQKGDHILLYNFKLLPFVIITGDFYTASRNSKLTSRFHQRDLSLLTLDAYNAYVFYQSSGLHL